MALSLRDKLGLQREAGQIKKQLIKATLREKIQLQKRWSEIIKQLKGSVKNTAQNTEIDKKANGAATGDNALAEPTDKQKEAGNYKKGRFNIHGMEIVIENPKGSTRSGVDPDGNKWSITMKHHYGDIKGTKGADGDPLDVFIGDLPESETVFIVDQVFDGQFDEHKVMLGFDSLASAKKAYLANYDNDWQGLGDITALPIDKFKQWAFAGKKSSPIGQITLPQQEVTFIERYQAGEFFSLEPLAFAEQVKQAHAEGLDFELNKAVIAEYLRSNESSLFELSK